MSLLSKQVFILCGEDKTGKTTFQKDLIKYLCNQEYDSLPVNLVFDIVHPRAPKNLEKISVMNRSIQEKIKDGRKNEYQDIQDFFKNHFQPADISVLSSHLVKSDIEEMLKMSKAKFFNVTGVFFENSISTYHKSIPTILELNWDEKIILPNPSNDNVTLIRLQIEKAAHKFGDMLIERSFTL
jgi:hypothetical protein